MNLSIRSQGLLNPNFIAQGHVKCTQDSFSQQNPKGYLNFGTAENDLMSEEITKILSRPIHIAPKHIHYTPQGLDSLKNVFCKFVQKYLKIDIEAANTVIMNGVSTVCEALSYCLLDAEDKIFIFSPYYGGFDTDFKIRFQGQLIPLPLSAEDDFYHRVELLDQAYTEHPQVKAVLISHPHNPTGRILSEKEISDIIQWCKSKNIHLIVDEIYALSLIQPKKPFISFFDSRFPQYENMHFLYGMAKDFGLGGYKVGFFHTKHQDLYKRMMALANFYAVSTHTQLVIENLLSDEIFLDEFIPQNQNALRASFEKLQKEFPQFKSAEAGLYCYTPLRNQISNSFQQDQQDFQTLLDQFKINILPGIGFHHNAPGYFRICFAKGNAAIEEFIVRFKNFSNT